MSLRTVLVDDEAIARRELRRLLGEHPEVEIVGEAGDVPAAVQLIEKIDPDLIFLDIRMPGADGFDLLERVDATPEVIFTTAYDRHAVRAFEVNALDYLLKPIAPERLAAALERCRSASNPAEQADHERLDTQQRVFVREGERCWFVALETVELFESEGNSTRLHFGGESPCLRRSLNYLESRLDPASFFRANRRQMPSAFSEPLGMVGWSSRFSTR